MVVQKSHHAWVYQRNYHGYLSSSGPINTAKSWDSCVDCLTVMALPLKLPVMRWLSTKLFVLMGPFLPIMSLICDALYHISVIYFTLERASS